MIFNITCIIGLALLLILVVKFVKAFIPVIVVCIIFGAGLLIYETRNQEELITQDQIVSITKKNIKIVSEEGLKIYKTFSGNVKEMIKEKSLDEN